MSLGIRAFLNRTGALEEFRKILKPYAGFFVRGIDGLLVVLLPLILYLNVVGDVRLDRVAEGFTVYAIHGRGSLLHVAILLLALRMPLAVLAGMAVFPANGWRLVFLKRLLELFLIVQIYLAATFFQDAPWLGLTIMPNAKVLDLGFRYVVANLFFLVFLRVLVGRHINAAILIASTVAALTAALFATEFVLDQRYRQELLDHYQRMRQVDPSWAQGDDFNPSRNDGKHWTWGHRVDYNSMNFREKEIEIPKPADTYRIMVLGDSLTWGAGLSLEQRYTKLLETSLIERNPKRRIEVLNFGYAGVATVREAAVLNQFADVVLPDRIVVGFCINDPQPLQHNYAEERLRFYPLYSVLSELRRVGLHHTYRFVLRAVDNTLIRSGVIPGTHAALDRTYDVNSEEWRDFVAALRSIKRHADRLNNPPPIIALLVQGLASDRPFHPYYSAWYDQVADAASGLGFVVVDPRDRFVREATLAELPVNPRDGHPSAKSNRLYADALLNAIALP